MHPSTNEGHKFYYSVKDDMHEHGVYAPTSDYDDTDVEAFYEQLQEVLDETPRRDILIVQGDWNAKVGEDARKDWKGTRGPYSNAQTNERGLLLLECTSYNDLF